MKALARTDIMQWDMQVKDTSTTMWTITSLELAKLAEILHIWMQSSGSGKGKRVILALVKKKKHLVGVMFLGGEIYVAQMHNAESGW